MRTDTTAEPEQGWVARAFGSAVMPAGFLDQAREEARAAGQPLVAVLTEQVGHCGVPMTQVLARLADAPAFTMDELRQMTLAFETISFADASKRACLPFRCDDGKLLIVNSDPFDVALQAWACDSVREPFVRGVASAEDIGALLILAEQSVSAVDSVLRQEEAAASGGTGAEEVSIRTISGDTSPVVKLVNSTLYDALKAGASDIHLETHPTGISIKYRIDGSLVSAGAAKGAELAEHVISRIKVMAELDIAEKRVPQDGRFKVSMQGRDVDFRVSVMPSVYGEDAVLRLLDKQALADKMHGLRLEYLGFDSEALRSIRRLSNEPYGMVLVTGPTGSGKTTTLYAALSEINTGEDKIITIEDPVEYQLSGVLQIPVNERKGLTFARGLRSILRHDPDKILVGEIRDAETAQIAVQSALTGHLVFTSVHANNAFDVIGRFTHMGVDMYNLVSALSGIVAQRLVRINCPHCTGEVQPDADLLSASNLNPEAISGARFMKGRGCGHCRGSGFKGRKAIAEVLHMNDEIRELIIAREPVRGIKEAAKRHGTRFLRDCALELAMSGETSLQEINRVSAVA